MSRIILYNLGFIKFKHTQNWISLLNLLISGSPTDTIIPTCNNFRHINSFPIPLTEVRLPLPCYTVIHSKCKLKAKQDSPNLRTAGCWLECLEVLFLISVQTYPCKTRIKSSIWLSCPGSPVVKWVKHLMRNSAVISSLKNNKNILLAKKPKQTKQKTPESDAAPPSILISRFSHLDLE